MELAGRVPISVVESIAVETPRPGIPPVEVIEALLLESAGFLSSRYADRFLEQDYIKKLKNQISQNPSAPPCNHKCTSDVSSETCDHEMSGGEKREGPPHKDHNGSSDNRSSGSELSMLIQPGSYSK
jgi:hypothetical protein